MQQLDFWAIGQPLLNDNDLTKKPPLHVDSEDAFIRRFYGQHFLNGWLKVKQKRAFLAVIEN